MVDCFPRLLYNKTMSKICLFSDIIDPFSLRLAQKFSEHEHTVVAMSDLSLPTEHPDSVSFRNICVYSGTPGSSLASVPFFRKVINEFNCIDMLLLFGLPERAPSSFETVGKLYFETFIDQRIKNLMFFLSEGAKLYRSQKLKKIVFVDYFHSGNGGVGNALWEGCFRAMAQQVCSKNSASAVPADWFQLRNEKPETAAAFVVEHLSDDSKTYPSVVVSEDKKQRSFFRF